MINTSGEENRILSAEVQNIILAIKLDYKGITKRINDIAAFDVLCENLDELKRKLDFQELTIATPDQCLFPILQIIRVEFLNGSVTIQALSAVHKILQYKLIFLKNGPSAVDVITDIITAVTDCKFKASEFESDQIVLYKIIVVLNACLNSEVAILLSGESILSIVKTLFKLSVQTRASPLLRKAAETALFEALQFVATRFNISSKHEFLFDYSDKHFLSSRHLLPTPQMNQTQFLESQDKSQSIDVLETTSFFDFDSFFNVIHYLYSMVSSKEHLVDKSQQFLSFSLLNTVLEVCKEETFAFKHMKNFLSNELSRHLIFTLRAENNVSVLTVIFSMFSNLFFRTRLQLCFSLKMFFQTVLEILTQDTKNLNTPHVTHRSSEFVEIALNTFLPICRDPIFPFDLFVIFDVSLSHASIYEGLVKYLLANILEVHVENTSERLFTEQIEWTSYQCLASLLTVMRSRVNSLPILLEKSKLANTFLKNRITFKNLYIESATLFNKDPSNGIKFYSESEHHQSVIGPHEVAIFLHENKFLKLASIGEFLAHRDNYEILRAYVALSDVGKKPFIEDLRSFLVKFRIPGETYLIERVLGEWSLQYVKNSSESFKSVGACSLLAMSAVLLNVLLYSPNIKKFTRPSLEGYIKQMHLQNDGDDYPEHLLKQIYSSIHASEILLPDEHLYASSEISAEIWAMLSSNFDHSQTNEYFNQAHSGAYDFYIFSSILFGPMLNVSTSLYFRLRADVTKIKHILGTLETCAYLAHHFECTEFFNQILDTLINLTGLLDEDVSSNLNHTFFSKPVTRFSTDLLFSLCNTYPKNIKSAWKRILKVMSVFYVINLVPLPMQDQLDLDVFNLKSFARPSCLSAENSTFNSKSLPQNNMLTFLYSLRWKSRNEKDLNSAQKIKDQLTDVISNYNFKNLFNQIALIEPDLLDTMVKQWFQKISFVNNDNIQQTLFYFDLLVYLAYVNPDVIHQTWPLIVTTACKFIVLIQQSQTTTTHAPPNLSERAVLLILSILPNLLQHALKTCSPLSSRSNLPLHQSLSCNEIEINSQVVEDLNTVVDGVENQEIAESYESNDRLEDTKSDDKSHHSNSQPTFEHQEKQSYVYSYDQHIHAAVSELFNTVELPSEYNVTFALDLLLGLECILGATHADSQCYQYSAHWIAHSLRFLYEKNVYFFRNSPYPAELVALIRSTLRFSTWSSESISATNSLINRTLFDSNLSHVNPNILALQIDAILQGIGCQLSEKDMKPEHFATIFEFTHGLLSLLPGFADTLGTNLLDCLAHKALEIFTSCCCKHSSKTNRSLFLNHFQRMLTISTFNERSPKFWVNEFNNVIFPWIDNMIYYNRVQPPGESFDDIELKTAFILCKTFLACLNTLNTDHITTLWPRIVQYLGIYYNIIKGDSGAITELLKTILLILKTSNVIVSSASEPPLDEKKSQLWNTTWKLIENFAPSLKADFDTSLASTSQPIQKLMSQ